MKYLIINSIVILFVLPFGNWIFSQEKKRILPIESLLELEISDDSTYTSKLICDSVESILKEVKPLEKSSKVKLLLLKALSHKRLNENKLWVSTIIEAHEIAKDVKDLEISIIELMINCSEFSYKENAIEFLNKYPKNSLISLQLGYLKFADDDFDDAIEYYNKAILLDSKNATAYFDRGRCLYFKGKCQEALNDFDRSLLLNPLGSERYPAYLLLEFRSHALSRLDRPHESLLNIMQAKKLIVVVNHDKNINWEIANVYIQMGKYHVARDLLERELDNNTDDFANASYAISLIGSGLFDKAEIFINKYIEDKNYFQALSYPNSSLAMINGDYSKASKIDSIRLLGNYRKVNAIYLYSTCPDTRYRDGQKAKKFAIELNNLTNYKIPKHLMCLAMAHAECGEFDEAIKYGEIAIKKMRPDFDYASQYRAILETFKAKKPFRHKKGELLFDFFR
jgi:tetratricopeptide (TPR) repeat protein